MDTTSFRIRRQRNGDIVFREAREVGEIRYCFSVLMSSNKIGCSHFPYTFGDMTVAVTGILGVPEIISTYTNLSIEKDYIVGTNRKGDDRMMFQDKEKRMIDKINFLLYPLSSVVEEWEIEPHE